MALTLKKSLGQHFLHDENMCLKIVDSLHQEPGMRLLEIGPGGGALTKYLLRLKELDYKAIEIDEEKVGFLKATYPEMVPGLLHQDFLQANVPFNDPFSVIGNFPYNISSQILFKLLDWEPQIDEVIGMFQKEVAQRVAAKEGNKSYGILSVLMQAFFEVKYLFDVPPGCFTPPPKVMSGVLRMTNTRNPFGIENKKLFFQMVKQAFGQRRKMLRNGWKGLFPTEVLVEDIFSKRAEQLSVEQFIVLYRRLLSLRDV